MMKLDQKNLFFLYSFPNDKKYANNNITIHLWNDFKDFKSIFSFTYQKYWNNIDDNFIKINFDSHLKKKENEK